MGKRVIFAVAGSGKTSYLIDKLNLEQRFLIITYTDNNEQNIRQRVIAKFGYLPNNIHILGYFSFLYSFCYKAMLSEDVGANGINFETPSDKYRRFRHSDIRYYLDEHGRVFSNRLALLCIQKQCIDDIKAKIEKYFDSFFIDEFQDFSGYDFDFALKIVPDNIETILVGDYYQHTYATSANGNKNQNLYTDGYAQYSQMLQDEGWVIDDQTLKKSYRCPIEVCTFVQDKIGISIESATNTQGGIELLSETDDIEKVMQDHDIIKLFFQNSRKYNCHAMNWGESKGVDAFKDVCVVLNKKTYEAFRQNKLRDMAALTKNKLYVACTRTRNKLYFIDEAQVSQYKI